MVLRGFSARGLADIIHGCARFACQKAIDTTGMALVELARHAWISRQVDLLDQTVRAILALPLDPGVQNVAHYYNAYALGRAGGPDQTRAVLDGLIDAALPEYKPRIILGLSGCHLIAGNLDESTRIYLEAARAASNTDAPCKSSALRGLALIRSIRGDHKGSLSDLERLFPVMRSFATSSPEDYRYYLNNLAYELGQVGRIEEAKAAINVALRSPNAHRFPDWAETAQELETMQRRVFYPVTLAVGTPADKEAARGEVHPPRPEYAAAACHFRSRSAYQRVSSPPPCAIEAPSNSNQTHFPSGRSQRRLVEIIEGVARFRSQAAVDATGRELVNLARQAWLCRDVDLVDRVAQAILTLPLDPRIHAVAHYYRALSGKMGAATDQFGLPGYWDSERIRILLEKLVDGVLPEHRARLLLGLGGCYFVAGDQDESARIQLEAARAAEETDPLSKCGALRGLALRECRHIRHVTEVERWRRFPS